MMMIFICFFIISGVFWFVFNLQLFLFFPLSPVFVMLEIFGAKSSSGNKQIYCTVQSICILLNGQLGSAWKKSFLRGSVDSRLSYQEITEGNFTANLWRAWNTVKYGMTGSRHGCCELTALCLFCSAFIQFYDPKWKKPYLNSWEWKVSAYFGLD